MRTLELFEESYKEAFEMLQDYHASYLNDDGSLPDGSALLPKRAIPDQVMQSMVDAGYGRVIDCQIWSDSDVIAHLEMSQYIDGDPHFSANEELIGCFSIEKVCAHYGNVGTNTSIWFVSDASCYMKFDLREFLKNPQVKQDRMEIWQFGIKKLGIDISEDH